MTPPVPKCIGIPAGSFLMGGIPEDKFVSTVELPRHEVTVRAFGMGIFPVTCGEWFAVTGSRPQQSDPSQPVSGVSYSEIELYLKILSQMTSCDFRLPSEAE